ncbi:MAG: ABC transporter permease [Alphaproteobacteria bacterium]
MTDVAGTLTAAPPRRRFWRRLARRKLLVAGAALLLVVIAAAVLLPLFLDLQPTRSQMRQRLKAPGLAHWFGTDNFGRDLLARVVVGAQISLLVGAATVIVTGVLGTMIGLAAGYVRRLDNAVMRLMDALMAFPSVLLAIAIAAALGPSILNVVIALGVTYTPRTARIVRASVLVVREAEYVEAARAAGAGHLRLVFRHILPNCLSPLLVQLTFIFAYAILAEAALSFLGIGPPPPTPTWGAIIADGRSLIREAPWICLFPGLAVSITVLGLNLIGDGLRDAFDPRMRVEQ